MPPGKSKTPRSGSVHEVRDRDIIDVVVGADEEQARVDRERRQREAPIEPGVPDAAIGDLDTLRYGEEREPRRTPPPPPQPERDVRDAAESRRARI